jgi:topoisomerase-4 subunit B
MDPVTRRLVQLEIDDIETMHETFDMLMSKSRAADRKTWITHNGAKSTIEA